MDITIAVNLDAGFFSDIGSKKNERQNPFSTGIATLDLLRYHLGLRTSAGSDIIITPEIQKTFITEMHEGKTFIQKGVEATEPLIPKIKNLIETMPS